MTDQTNPLNDAAGKMLPVTKAMRDAAYAMLVRAGFPGAQAAMVMNGEADDHWSVQAFRSYDTQQYPFAVITPEMMAAGKAAYERDNPDGHSPPSLTTKLHRFWRAAVAVRPLPPVEPADGGEAWTVRQSAEYDGQFEAGHSWDVLLPNGSWRGVLAVDPEDARQTIREEWDAEQREAARLRPPTPEPLPAGLEERARELLVEACKHWNYPVPPGHMLLAPFGDEAMPWLIALAAIRKALSSPVAEMAQEEGDTDEELTLIKSTAEDMIGHSFRFTDATISFGLVMMRYGQSLARLNHRPMTAEVAGLVERLRGYVADGDAFGARAKHPTTIAVRMDIEKAADLLASLHTDPAR